LLNLPCVAPAHSRLYWLNGAPSGDDWPVGQRRSTSVWSVVQNLRRLSYLRAPHKLRRRHWPLRGLYSLRPQQRSLACWRS